MAVPANGQGLWWKRPLDVTARSTRALLAAYNQGLGWADSQGDMKCEVVAIRMIESY